MTAEPTEVTLKITWKWSALAIVVGIWIAVLGVALSIDVLDADFVEYTAVLIAGIAYVVLVQLRYRVTLTGDGIIVRAWRHKFIPRDEVAAIEVRRLFGGRRLTVIRTDGTTAPLPVPWPRDSRWDEMVHQVELWVANSQHDDARST